MQKKRSKIPYLGFYLQRRNRQSSSEPEEEFKRTSMAKQGLGYIDERAKVLTYFKLWCSPGSATSSGVGMRRNGPHPPPHPTFSRLTWWNRIQFQACYV